MQRIQGRMAFIVRAICHNGWLLRHRTGQRRAQVVEVQLRRGEGTASLGPGDGQIIRTKAEIATRIAA